ncbi:hypothetical protein LGT39_00985 [Demequina sp. TTPB684]|uniref:DUF6933 domain-containing protein n=1 Tax=unclassified Demequina TaxID=2620311 RepID=UPI001CF2E180|nr:MULTISPECIES: hypothetical protein [unclassified Demequina]MCB2411420.1 hypothetical protein [Demequina sp. TTPB684]UPU88094.1 hypothetical protein LGT36_012725 [Demequina sp. TMPB413]
MNQAPPSALRLHATVALAAKLGGFTPNPAPAPDPMPLDAWYAHLIRRRKPRVMVMNAATLMTVIVPLAPAVTFFDRLPAYIAAQLDGLLISHEFIHAHVDRIAGRGAVLKTADRSLVGILNRRLYELDYWDPRSEGEWEEVAFRFTDTITLSVGEPHHGLDRLFNVVNDWEERQTR